MWARKQLPIAGLALLAIALHLILGSRVPLYVALILGGLPLVIDLTLKLVRREFGSDLLAGISIVTAILLDEYLAGTLVVLMLSGGEAIEQLAVRRASSVLKALANRMPSTAHRQRDGELEEITLDDVRVGDTLVVLPHGVAPVDGTVVGGHGVMDEAFLTGEPYVVSKTPGSQIISGAINGEHALTLQVDRLPVDSRYAAIMRVMRQSEQQRPRIRRLGDRLGAFYTPLAVTLALIAWAISGEAVRFLAVLVVATPCPLLIAIPVSIIGSISLAARRGIIVRDPAALETVDRCRTVIFDKTGTLTYGRPELTEIVSADGVDSREVLGFVASLERYSKHPLAGAVVHAAKELKLADAERIREVPGEGLLGIVRGRRVHVTGRDRLGDDVTQLPEIVGGLECVVLLDGVYAATLRFRDEPRSEGVDFIRHLTRRHHFERVLLVSGDRESEVRYLADRVGITEVYAEQSPEQKLAIVQAETARAPTVFVGDGINDAPALVAATVGIALGQHHEVTSEAAGAVVMDSTLTRVDEFFHIGSRMRSIAMQSAVGGMALSVVGMGFAAVGLLTPVLGALVQEVIDVIAVLNSTRAALKPRSLSDI
ncbi:MAG: heavy metal translocating P-type ATPase [Acidobacteriota bacterium]|nr:heavy metal translocating P-type ATPase [Acidobacteriota bacterium]MDH3786628.1 heavy metal translocating P-type ATPase [Acidobacteriota bacterium]